MISFTQNDWGQCDIINRIIILTKRGTDTRHSVIPTKYQKYPSTTILKHMNYLDKLNKSPYVCLLTMAPHDAYSITTNVCTMTISEISHKQKD